MTLTEAYERRLEFYNKNHDPRDGRFTTGVHTGKMWTGVSAHPDRRIKPTPTDVDLNGFTAGGLATAKRLYEVDLGGGYTSHVTHTQHVEGGRVKDVNQPGSVMQEGLAVQGEIRFNGRVRGGFERLLYKNDKGELVADHELLVIDGDHKGHGLADRFNAHAVAEYQRIGVDRITLTAGDLSLVVGGYAWARQGFRLNSTPRSNKKFIAEQLSRLDTQLLKPVYREHADQIRAEIAALSKALDAGEDVQPIHIASIGERYARHETRDEDGVKYQTWPGKDVLLGTSWKAVYYFDAAKPLTADATDLEHADLRPAFRAEWIEFYNRNHNPLDGRFSSGTGVSQVSPGARVWWRMDGGSAQITQAAYDIVGGQGGSGDEHTIAQDMLTAINSQPVRTTSLFSGHLRDTQHEVGDVIDIPLMALGYRRGLALAYAGIDPAQGRGGDPIDTTGNRMVKAVMDGLRVVYPGKTNREIWDGELPEALRDQIGQAIAGHRLITEHRQPAVKVIYEFVSSKSALIAEGFERATSGRYKVSAVEVTPIKGSWLWDQRSHELVQETYTVVKLEHVGDLSVTASAEEFYNHNHDPNTGRFATGGRRTYNDYGSWGNSWQGSSTITGQAAEIMGLSGYFSGGHPARMDERYGFPGINDETRAAQIRDAHDHAVQLLGAIHDAVPFNEPLYSGIAIGAARFAGLRPGDRISLPTTATSYDRELAHESGERPYEQGDMFKAETGIREGDLPVVLKFEAGTKAVKYHHNYREMITAGHFEVVSVDRVKSPYELFRRELNDLPVADAIEITLRQLHTVDPDQPITASGQWDDFACHDKSCAPPPVGIGGSRSAVQARRGAVAGYGPAGLRDVHLAGVRVTYKPDYPDDHPDPGEVVWAKVPFEDDPSQSKDRPVLIIGRVNGSDKLAAVQLTSQVRGRSDEFVVGKGTWDRLGRNSAVKLGRIIQIDPSNYRREGSVLERERFDSVIGRLAAHHRTPVTIAAAAWLEEFYNSNHDPRDGRFTSGPGGVSAGPKAKGVHLSRDETRGAPNTTEFGRRINAMLDGDPNLRDMSKATIDAHHAKKVAAQLAIAEDELLRAYTVNTPPIDMRGHHHSQWERERDDMKDTISRHDAAEAEMRDALQRIRQVRDDDYVAQNPSEKILQDALDKRIAHDDIHEPLLITGDFGYIKLPGAKLRNIDKDRSVLVDNVMEQAVNRVGQEIRKEIDVRHAASFDAVAETARHTEGMAKALALAEASGPLYAGSDAVLKAGGDGVTVTKFSSGTLHIGVRTADGGQLGQGHPVIERIKQVLTEYGITTHSLEQHVGGKSNAAHNRIVHEVLSEITQLGGRLNGTPAHRKPGWRGGLSSHEQVVAAVKKYPDTWLEASNDGTPLKFRQTSGRAHYQHNASGGKSEVTLDGSVTTAIHELAHRFERTVPGVRQLEALFHERRTVGEREEWMGKGYGKHEVTKPDQFFERYAGKTYHGTAFELLSMGYEYLHQRKTWDRMDDDYKSFVLGTLVVAYRG